MQMLRKIICGIRVYSHFLHRGRMLVQCDVSLIVIYDYPRAVVRKIPEVERCWRQFRDEPRRQVVKTDCQFFPRARHRDLHQTPLFLNFFLRCERPRVGQDAFVAADEVNRVKFESLGKMNGH